MTDWLPVFCDEEFVKCLNDRCGFVQKEVGLWAVTLYGDSPELWLELAKLQSSPLLTIIYRHWFDEPGIFINNRGATKEQVIDIVFGSQDTEFQNIFLFNDIL